VSEDCQSFGTFGSGVRRVRVAFSVVGAGTAPPAPVPDGRGGLGRRGNPGGGGTRAAGEPGRRGNPGGGSGQGLAGTATRPRAIAALAIAVQAARVGAPLGRLSVDLRAYTVNR
jgi:hypothetical protein